MVLNLLLTGRYRRSGRGHPMHWHDNTSNCYYWQIDNVRKTAARFYVFSGTCLVGKYRGLSIVSFEKPQSFARISFNKGKIFFCQICRHGDTGYVKSRVNESSVFVSPLGIARRNLTRWAKVRRRAPIVPRRSASSDSCREIAPSRKLHRKR